MKILDINKIISGDELHNLLLQKLNPLFQQQKQSDINFTITHNSNIVEISHPEIYEGVLFSIAIEGHELHITRSEHYTDDVNSLTLESILNTLFEELAGEGKVTLILEG
ncbi:hypothetical protein [Mucilaginibacter sp.]|uniref:hypothetical protein n=1 Tax=Mucilaginibacter sp. TaxID=1882438 RepID=UPI003D120D37